MNRYYTIIILVVLLLLTGCKEKAVENKQVTNVITTTNEIEVEHKIDVNKIIDIKAYKEIKLKFSKIDNKDSANYNTKVITLPEYKNNPIFDYCYWDNEVYYVLDNEDNADFSRDISIHKFDSVSKLDEIIYNYKNEAIGHNIVELCSDGTHLFWLEMIESETLAWEIHQLNMQDKTEKVIYSSNELTTELYPLIRLKGHELYWYYADEDSKFSICKFNIDSKTVTFDASELYLFSPWQHFNVDGEFSCYLKKDKNNNVIIHSKSTVTGDEMTINTALNELVDAVSNRNCVIWQDQYISAKIYIYGIKNDKIYTYDTSKSGEEIHQFGFIGDYIYIQFNVDTNGDSNLYFLDIENNTMKQVTNNTDEKIYYLCYKNSSDNQITAEVNNHSLTEILVVDLK